ncbi:ABC transporter ATP-binding protein/permease [Komarekiella delphini-convector]|nr:ABC transporter ATP-binding protein/permease [Komarekiella delphini-convector]
MALIRLNKVSKTFSQGLFQGFSEKPVLENIDLTIHPGEFLALKGKSGAGKTTLLKIILGLLEPTSGEVQLMGLSPHLPESKTRIGVVFQEASLPENMTAKELIQLVRSYYPDPLSTEEVIRAVNLTDEEQNTWATQLPGGGKQRLYFGKALAGKPALLILDEPTRNLDEDAYKEFWRQVARCRERGVTVLMVTHSESDLNRLNQLATRIVTLHKITEAPASGQLSQQILRDTPAATPVPAESIEMEPSLVPSQLQRFTTLFKQQLWAEGLQILRTPTFLLGILFFAGFSAFLPGQGDSAKQAILSFGGILLLTVAIDRLGKRVAVERRDRWSRFLRSTPLPPAIYLAVKICTTLLVCAVSLLLILVLGGGLHQVQASIGEWILLFLSLLIGVIPFALLGLGLSYLIDPKSYDAVAGLALPIGLSTSGAFPLSKSSFVQDLVAFSPFFHYQQLTLWAAGLEGYDQHIWLHILWLLWASIVFGLATAWAYRRDQAVQ